MFKKIFFVTALAVFAAGAVQAEVKLGPRMGFTFTNAYGSGIDTRLRMGIQIGVVADFALNDVFSIQPGVVYSQQGVKLKLQNIDPEDEWDVEYTDRIRLNYVQIPVYAQFTVSKFYIQAGPYLGIATSGNSKLAEGNTFGSGFLSAFGQADEEKIKFGNERGQINRFELGLGFGAGFAFKVVQLGVNYNLGLTNLRYTERLNGKTIEMRNKGVSITVTLLFGK
ncbi:hypothetical protein FACS189430_10050 [Bacteroidia bacterium]|nr:hypothetical protein FACS189430_10050 [Bacteroidia bacterium]